MVIAEEMQNVERRIGEFVVPGLFAHAHKAAICQFLSECGLDLVVVPINSDAKIYTGTHPSFRPWRGDPVPRYELKIEGSKVVPHLVERNR